MMDEQCSSKTTSVSVVPTSELDFERVALHSAGGNWGNAFVARIKDSPMRDLFLVIRFTSKVLRVVPEARDKLMTAVCQHQAAQAQCRFVLQLFGAVDSPHKGVYLQHAYFPSGGGTLTERTRRLGFSNFVKQNLQILAAEMALAIQAFHSVGLYGCFNVDNIFLTTEGHVRVQPDLESSFMRNVDNPEANVSSMVMYSAPELFVQNRAMPPAGSQDWWCLGALLFRLRFARHVFDGSSIIELIKKVVKPPDDYSNQIDWPEEAADEEQDASLAPFKDLIRRLVNKDLAMRYKTAEQVLQHPYFVDTWRSVVSAADSEDGEKALPGWIPGANTLPADD